MKLEALDHPKTLDLAARLNVEIPTAIGYLELLWAFTGKKSPQGNIGKFPNGAIARGCMYNGDPDRFVQSLVECGYVDLDETYRLVIHDWHEHAPRWVKSKLKTLGLSFLILTDPLDEAPGTGASDNKAKKGCDDDAQVDNDRDTSGDISRPISNDTKGREVQEKTREVKGSELPDWLDLAIWDRWEQFRREIRKPLTPTARKEQLEFLGENRHVHKEILLNSIRNGWQGLFPVKSQQKTVTAGNIAVARNWASKGKNHA